MQISECHRVSMLALRQHGARSELSSFSRWTTVVQHSYFAAQKAHVLPISSTVITDVKLCSLTSQKGRLFSSACSTSAVSQHHGGYGDQATLSLISIEQAVQHCVQQKPGLRRFAKEVPQPCQSVSSEVCI